MRADRAGPGARRTPDRAPRWLTRWVAGASCLALAGCATQAGTASGECAAVGGGGGYVACKALGKSDHDCLIVAMVGAVVGGAGCYAYASNLEAHRKELQGKENNLDARIRYVRQLNADSRDLNAKLAAQVKATTRDTDALVAQLASGRVDAQRLARERKARDDAIADAKTQAVASQDALVEVTAYKARNKPQSPQFNAELAQQEQFNADIQQQVGLLVAQRSRF